MNVALVSLSLAVAVNGNDVAQAPQFTVMPETFVCVAVTPPADLMKAYPGTNFGYQLGNSLRLSLDAKFGRPLPGTATGQRVWAAFDFSSLPCSPSPKTLYITVDYSAENEPPFSPLIGMQQGSKVWLQSPHQEAQPIGISILIHPLYRPFQQEMQNRGRELANRITLVGFDKEAGEQP